MKTIRGTRLPLPFVFVPALMRGSRVSLWVISILAVLTVLDSLTIPFDLAVWVPAVFLLAGAILLWLPSSSRYLRARREERDHERTNRGPLLSLAFK